MVLRYISKSWFYYSLGLASTIFSDVVEARRIQALLSKHLSNFGPKITLNFTDCFGGKGFALDPNNGLQTLSKSFLFLSH